MDKSVILLGIIGYVGVMVRSIPNRIISYLIRRYALTMTSGTRDYGVYRSINSWLVSKDIPVVKNNVEIKYEFIDGRNQLVNEIALGDYSFRLDKFTFCFVTKSLMDKVTDTAAERMSVKIFGINQAKYMDEIKATIVKENNGDSLTIITNGYMNVRTRKSFDDVFMKEKQTLIDYINKWEANEELYNKYGICHKTGILLWGEPGTGKSTTAKAIASYLGYNLKIVDVKGYGLTSELCNMSKGCVVLLEDIDCAVGNRENDDMDSDDKSTLGMLLNAIDGVNSPEKTIFVATTNHIDKLDPALIRPGRFNLHINMSHIDESLAKEMCDRYEISYDALDGEQFPINPSYLQNKLLQLRLG